MADQPKNPVCWHGTCDFEPPPTLPVALATTVVDYRVEPDPEGDGEWHVLTFWDGKQVEIYTQHPLVIVDAEVQ